MMPFDPTEYYRQRYRNDPEHRSRIKAAVKRYTQRKRRERIIALYGCYIDQCQSCGRKLRFKKYVLNGKPAYRSNLHVHHVNIESYFRETGKNTMILCDSCHATLHNISGHPLSSWLREVT